MRWTSRLLRGEARLLWGLTAAVFLVCFGLFASLYLSLHLLYDTDSYFHMAVAREYGRVGIFQGLRWARFSLMHEGYGDKEFLFHMLLVPFTSWMDAETGGKLALALLDAAFAASLFNLAARTAGLWALWAPVMAVGLSGSLLSRLIRLRPELLAVMLLLWIAWAVSQRRTRTAALLCFTFALAYTAVQALVGLLGIWFVWQWWRQARPPLGLPLLCLPAIALGLLVHPQFPSNLQIWLVQNVQFFMMRGELDVGGEFRALSAAEMLHADWAFWLVALTLWLSRRKHEAVVPLPQGTAAVFWLACIPFGVLFVTGARFATFLMPFFVLAVFFELNQRGSLPSPRLALPAGLRLRTALVLAACCLGLIGSGQRLFVTFAREGGVLPDTRDHMRELGRALPAGARVAAPWAMADDYVFWAPQALYLNVLDPVFMHTPHPERYALQRALFDGQVPDVPLAVWNGLDSDHLAFQRRDSPLLERRLQADPRSRELVRGIHLVHALQPDHNRRFLLDWQVDGHPYPRLPPRQGGALEGYVNAQRLGSGASCLRFVHRFQQADAGRRLLELAPLGPATLWLDGRELARRPVPSGAILGEGVAVHLQLAPGSHELAVESCAGPGGNGFYLLDRTPR